MLPEMITALNLTNVLFDVNGFRESALVEPKIFSLNADSSPLVHPHVSRLIVACILSPISHKIAQIYLQTKENSVLDKTCPPPKTWPEKTSLTQAGWPVCDQSDVNFMLKLRYAERL